MPFRHSYDVIIKWGDCDPAGIVFYPQFFAMFDEATGFLFQAASGMTRTTLIRHYGIVGWPMVDARASFKSPVSYDDRVTIDTEVHYLGRSSIQLDHRLHRDAVLCVECRETRVWTARTDDGDRLTSSPIPDEFRLQLLTGNDGEPVSVSAPGS